MKRISFVLLYGFLFLIFIAADATAGNVDPIFTALADRASNVGSGLRNVGIIIAGFGLVVFSFMAIFNKISWKTLAYIMMSTFILSVTGLIVSYISGKNVEQQITFSDIKKGFADTYSDGAFVQKTDPTQVKVEGKSPE